MRKVLAALGGVVIGGVLIWLVEMLGHSIYPPPDGIDFTDPEAIRQMMSEMPVGAFVLVLAAHAIGTYAAAAVATYAGRSEGVGLGLIVATVFLVLGGINLAVLPHPLWFIILDLVIYLPAGWLGARLALRFSAAPPIA